MTCEQYRSAADTEGTLFGPANSRCALLSHPGSARFREMDAVCLSACAPLLHTEGILSYLKG